MNLQRNSWIDILRIIACVMVVIGHCCDPFVAKLDDFYPEFLAGAIIGSFARSSVPLFVMMTAVLLLPIKESLSKFYSKRIQRVAFALLFWSILSPILFYLYLNFVNPESIHPNIIFSNHTLVASVQKIYTLFFNFNYETLIYWYIYMLIGLYLIMPIVSAWIEKATKKELRIILLIWLFTTFLPILQVAAPIVGYQGNSGNMGLYGICDWNPFGMFHYVSGFIGYMFLAYYFNKYPLQWSWKKTLSILIPIFILGYLITLFGFLQIQKVFPGDFAKLEIIWFFNNPNVLMMTLPLFLLGQKITTPASNFLSKTASLMFGVYLLHFIFVHIAYDFFYPLLSIHPLLKIVIMGLSTFIITAILCYLISLSKWGRKFIL